MKIFTKEFDFFQNNNNKEIRTIDIHTMQGTWYPSGRVLITACWASRAIVNLTITLLLFPLYIIIFKIFSLYYIEAHQKTLKKSHH